MSAQKGLHHACGEMLYRTRLYAMFTIGKEPNKNRKQKGPLLFKTGEGFPESRSSQEQGTNSRHASLGWRSPPGRRPVTPVAMSPVRPPAV